MCEMNFYGIPLTGNIRLTTNTPPDSPLAQSLESLNQKMQEFRDELIKAKRQLMRGVYCNHNRLVTRQWFLVKPSQTPGYYTQAHHRICIDVLGVLS